MANKENIKVFYCDSLGTITTKSVLVTGMVVKPSADTWLIEIKDTAGNNVLYDGSSITNDRNGKFSLAKPVEIKGLSCVTLTNISYALIYIDDIVTTA